MFERILIPIDASTESLLALPFASQLAEATGARLRLLRVVLAYEVATAGTAAPGSATVPPFVAGAVGATGPRAEEVILRAERASDIPLAIVDEARAFDADLIVMATHARSGFDRLTHQSVTEAVLANTAVPLLLVNATRVEVGGEPGDPIIVAVDGTPEGAQALPFAMQYARALGTELLLLRVVPPQFGDDFSSELCFDPTALADAQN